MPGAVVAGGSTLTLQPSADLRKTQSSRHASIGCTATASAFASRFFVADASQTMP